MISDALLRVIMNPNVILSTLNQIIFDEVKSKKKFVSYGRSRKFVFSFSLRLIEEI